MAALRNLFSRPASQSSALSASTEDIYANLPARMDAVWVEWQRSHICVRSGTVLDGIEYKHERTSLTRIRKSSVARTVYFYTQLRRLRGMCRMLEIELQVSRDSWRSVGLMLDDSIPRDLAVFLVSDPGVARAAEYDLEYVGIPRSDVFAAASGLLGLLAVCDQLVD